MIFRQWLDTDSERCGYLLADPVTRAAAVVDVHEGIAEGCLSEIRRLGLDLYYLFETRLHVAQRSAAAWLQRETEARVVAHADTGIACADLQPADGEAFYLGEESITFLHVPGLCPGASALIWGDRLFSGDTIWPGGSGPLGPGGDPRSLRAVIEGRIFRLPDETVVFPGACPGGRRVTTIGEERAGAGQARRPWRVRHLDDDQGLRPDIAAFNRECSQRPQAGHHRNNPFPNQRNAP
ncbi:MAG: MBL fold metallo-hydrolase [Pseudomonadota bacterium]